MSLKVHSIKSAPDLSKPILDAVGKNFGFVPNLMGVFASNPETLKSYLALSDALSKSGLSPLEQQIVAITVSRENNCEYCVAAHSAISAMSSLDQNVVNQLRSGGNLADKKLEALRAFTQKITAARGWIDSAGIEAFRSAGYDDSHVLAVVLGIAMKTLSNYTNHIAQTPLDEKFAPFKWSK